MKLTMTKRRIFQSYAHNLKSLTLGLVDGHGEGHTNGKLQTFKDKGQGFTGWHQLDPWNQDSFALAGSGEHSAFKQGSCSGP